jgi:hypothetical protein
MNLFSDAEIKQSAAEMEQRVRDAYRKLEERIRFEGLLSLGRKYFPADDFKKFESELRTLYHARYS